MLAIILAPRDRGDSQVKDLRSGHPFLLSSACLGYLSDRLL